MAKGRHSPATVVAISRTSQPITRADRRLLGKTIVTRAVAATGGTAGARGDSHTECSAAGATIQTVQQDLAKGGRAYATANRGRVRLNIWRDTDISQYRSRLNRIRLSSTCDNAGRLNFRINLFSYFLGNVAYNVFSLFCHCCMHVDLESHFIHTCSNTSRGFERRTGIG